MNIYLLYILALPLLAHPLPQSLFKSFHIVKFVGYFCLPFPKLPKRLPLGKEAVGLRAGKPDAHANKGNTHRI
jgi:hypothetical protein